MSVAVILVIRVCCRKVLLESYLCTFNSKVNATFNSELKKSSISDSIL